MMKAIERLETLVTPQGAIFEVHIHEDIKPEGLGFSVLSMGDAASQFRSAALALAQVKRYSRMKQGWPRNNKYTWHVYSFPNGIIGERSWAYGIE